LYCILDLKSTNFYVKIAVCSIFIFSGFFSKIQLEKIVGIKFGFEHEFIGFGFEFMQTKRIYLQSHTLIYSPFYHPPT